MPNRREASVASEVREPDAALDCAAARRQLWEFLDEELTDDRMEAMRAHIARCAACFPHYDFERTFLGAVAAQRERQAAPPALRLRVVSALRVAGFAPR